MNDRHSLTDHSWVMIWLGVTAVVAFVIGRLTHHSQIADAIRIVGYLVFCSCLLPLIAGLSRLQKRMDDRISLNKSRQQLQNAKNEKHDR